MDKVSINVMVICILHTSILLTFNDDTTVLAMTVYESFFYNYVQICAQSEKEN